MKVIVIQATKENHLRRPKVKEGGGAEVENIKCPIPTTLSQ